MPSRPSGSVRSPDEMRSGSRRWPGCTRCYCASRSGSPGGAGRGARITGPELEDLAYQAAADALVAITGNLGQFRGDSRFTTWAYKFVIFEVSDKIGRHFWRNPGVRLEAEDWDRLPDRFGFEAAREAEWRDLLAALRRAVNTELSPGSVRCSSPSWSTPFPLDALVIELGSSRGAIYKTMFDARRNLRAALAANCYMDHDTAGRWSLPRQPT